MSKRIALWLRDFLIRRKSFNSTRFVVISFAVIILTGALLLMLPISSNSGTWTDFLPCLFTATSSTCVTGLILVDTAVHWSLFGQIVIIVMIQLGGLGFMTIFTLISLALRRRIGLSERLAMASTFNLNDMDGVVRVVRHAIIGTFTMEGIGALLLASRFIPDLGLAKGLWAGVFHGISAFCNAGFDVLGDKYGAFTSIISYNDDPVVLLVTGALIVIGGLGFFVWEDIWVHRSWKKFSLYTKMVLTMTAMLLVVGGLFFFIVEHDNPATLGDMPFWQKGLNSLFQSITLRTAGFDSIGQGGLQDSSKALSVILMLVGGSSGSTAGGVKTGTVAVLLLAFRASLAGREQVTIRGRSISYRRVMDAMTLVLMVVFLFLASSMVISTIEPFSYLDTAYEVASAMGTVGVTTGITPSLTAFSQSILIALMYLGRVGIMSFSVAFLVNRQKNAKIKYPTVDIMIG